MSIDLDTHAFDYHYKKRKPRQGAKQARPDKKRKTQPCQFTPPQCKCVVHSLQISKRVSADVLENRLFCRIPEYQFPKWVVSMYRPDFTLSMFEAKDASRLPSVEATGAASNADTLTGIYMFIDALRSCGEDVMPLGIHAVNMTCAGRFGRLVDIKAIMNNAMALATESDQVVSSKNYDSVKLTLSDGMTLELETNRFPALHVSLSAKEPSCNSSIAMRERRALRKLGLSGKDVATKLAVFHSGAVNALGVSCFERLTVLSVYTIPVIYKLLCALS